MKKCVKIIMNFDADNDILRNFIHKKACNSSIEGSVQALDNNQIKIIACGKSDLLEEFIDDLYRGYKKIYPKNIAVKPFLRLADYRGVFRIIE